MAKHHPSPVGKILVHFCNNAYRIQSSTDVSIGIGNNALLTLLDLRFAMHFTHQLVTQTERPLLLRLSFWPVSLGTREKVASLICLLLFFHPHSTRFSFSQGSLAKIGSGRSRLQWMARSVLHFEPQFFFKRLVKCYDQDCDPQMHLPSFKTETIFYLL